MKLKKIITSAVIILTTSTPSIVVQAETYFEFRSSVRPIIETYSYDDRGYRVDRTPRRHSYDNIRIETNSGCCAECEREKFMQQHRERRRGYSDY